MPRTSSLLPRSTAVAAAAALALAAQACGSAAKPDPMVEHPELEHRLSTPNRMCTRASPSPNSCRTAGEIERILQHPDLRIVGDHDPPSGIQDTRVFTLSSRIDGEEVVLRAKWRLHQRHNSYSNPRRELLAYHAQKLFLEPHQYVVPPTVGRCFPLPQYRRQVEAGAERNFEGADCVFGYLSYWLERTQLVSEADDEGWFDSDRGVLDEDLFEENLTYRKRLSDINLVAYLINHGDSHKKQFVISETPGNPVIYLVDNSMAFDGTRNTDIPEHDYSKLHLPAYSRRSVERLLGAGQRIESLGAIARYRLDPAAGVLVQDRLSSPHRPLGEDGLLWDGENLFVGYSPKERGIMAERLSRLKWVVNAGELSLYEAPDPT